MILEYDPADYTFLPLITITFFMAYTIFFGIQLFNLYRYRKVKKKHKKNIKIVYNGLTPFNCKCNNNKKLNIDISNFRLILLLKR